jgi:hypothetical protein
MPEPVNPSDTLVPPALWQAIRLAIRRDGHPQLGAVLRGTGRTLYGKDPAAPGYLVRIAPDGTRSLGHLVNRRFVSFT